LSEPRIRAATAADAQEIACVHVQAWRESYRDLMPAAMLASLSVERSARMWTDILAGEAIVKIVEAPSGIVGFGSAGVARDALLGTTGEITSIYLLEHAKRRGIGRTLLTSLMRALVRGGHASAGLWVLIDNHGTRRFYQALGGQPGETRVIRRDDADLHEIAYVWSNLARFAAAG
jgi:ribosomal protein S18 acetylase RimI-like enzyme